MYVYILVLGRYDPPCDWKELLGLVPPARRRTGKVLQKSNNLQSAIILTNYFHQHYYRQKI